MKCGVDFRRLSPLYRTPAYDQTPVFLDVASAEAGNPLYVELAASHGGSLLFHNLGVFAQDTWRVLPALTVTYGVRWDVDFAPNSSPGLLAVTGFDLTNLSNLALAPAGTPPFHTTYGNVAPRLGLAYEISHSQKWQTLLHAGFGSFFDLATSEIGNGLFFANYPFGATQFVFGSFPLNSTAGAPPSITTAALASGNLTALDPNLELPYTLQWNVAFEQALGTEQTVSASYVGAAGKRLLQTAEINAPNPRFAVADLVSNAATSNYNALQIQFQRRLSHGLQVLASFTWSHSIDTASAGSLYGDYANALTPGINPNANRGSSDFDVRDGFSSGLTYDVPVPKVSRPLEAIVRAWSVQSVIQARSSSPVNIYSSSLSFATPIFTAIRPDVVPGVPLYLDGSQFPGNKAFNPAAFTPPPIDPSSGVPLRQGTLPRNALQGFSAAQWDFAVHRNFAIHESLGLEFRAEIFNILNHPNFGPPVGNLGASQFGQSTQMLGQYLSGGTLGANTGGGAFSPLYQIGGPRSIQLALKLRF